MATLTVKEKIARAKELGKASFFSGGDRVPAHNEEVIAMIQGEDFKPKCQIMKAYTNAWMHEYLEKLFAEEVTEQEEQPEAIEEVQPVVVEPAKKISKAVSPVKAFEKLTKRQQLFVLGNLPMLRSGRTILGTHDTPEALGLSRDDMEALTASGFITVQRGEYIGTRFILTPVSRQVAHNRLLTKKLFEIYHREEAIQVQSVEKLA